ncbi:helix-hairpin-helix domain-containing protein [Streptomyces sp. CB01881]|uniref:helix-hairpin-helix domain-containing protein n=1 Tax=Streptomyces sp. CB01881 TaxID=2078691 RepID=UPI000CDBACE4|nr:helix-hairpin-helix domain-containing protein [Streptomyces sp. CB01881]AUY48596.1 DNA polymerase/3'-5' exonuclease PolX [Streptomyces sp. CB01881]TYC77089.1 DNA polymerase/3'-5' exonuclease PolX [Streptomyces sp. CB01881]
MTRLNDQVQELLQEYADLISITGGDAFRARAYEKAARAVGGYPEDVAGLDAKGLQQIPGVGKSTAEKVAQYLTTGRMEALETLRAAIPPGVREMMAVPSMGPKRALALYQDLGIASVGELADAIRADRLSGVAGFGERSGEKILHGIELMRQSGGLTLLDAATEQAEQIVAAIAAVPGCTRCAYAGSLRRMRETVGDIDVLATAEDSAPLMAALTELPYVAEVIVRGPTKTSVRTAKGIQVDLRVVPEEDWGAALLYFTGSKAHNIKLRTMAVRTGLKLSEYGLFEVANAGNGDSSGNGESTEGEETTQEAERSASGANGAKVVSATEEEVYAALGLPWIAPPLREDRGEIEAALRRELPELVTEADLRGDLHTHTDLTDGLAGLEEMIDTAAARGYAYYAVTDHAPDLVMQRMTDEKMLAQREQLRELAGRHRKMRLLHGTELNIGPEGGVDWPAEFLAGFDVCVASVHSHFGADRATQTRRLIRACENPHVHVIGHLTTRRIGRRGPIDVDLDAVFEAAARTGTAIEVNSSPQRLDLRDEDVLRAKRYGVKFSIDSDAHATGHLAYPRYGIGTAQRAWLTTEDVINAWPWQRLKRFLRKDALR